MRAPVASTDKRSFGHRLLAPTGDQAAAIARGYYRCDTKCPERPVARCEWMFQLYSCARTQTARVWACERHARRFAEGARIQFQLQSTLTGLLEPASAAPAGARGR